MEKTTLRVRRGLPVWAVVLISALGTAVLLLGAFGFLLGREGLAVMEGWLLARYAFVETDSSLDAAADGALWGMVSGLGDRWSYYVDPDSYASLMDRRANRYLGIGITVSLEDARGLVILAVTPGGPAQAAGLLEGELITSVDGQDVTGEARYDGTSLISGAAGEERVLTVVDSGGRTRTVKVVLDYIQQDVVTGELLENGMGLVTIANFNTNANEQFRNVVEELTAQGATALIFDVRNDGGGYIRELTQILDFLLPEGDVFQSDPRWGPTSVSHSDADCVELPFGVLVNTETYSAAELFAAQLRESVNAPIVGEVTSGKGYSQITFRLANGGALGLSTARYCTGSGVSLVGVGITPDIILSLDETQSARLSTGSLPPEEDPQLQALIELMEGK